jgi:hypothetical protein
MAAMAGGCGAHRAYLVPAPTANLTNGGHAATASADGIMITVTPNSWDGTPRDLSKTVTPLEARIENHSDQPLRLAYEDFHLETPQGNLLFALPPSEIRGTQYVGENRTTDAHFVDANWQRPGRRRDRRPTRVVVVPQFRWRGFFYAPYWGYAYPGIGPWPYPWAPNFGYYSTYYPYMRAVHLPTKSMLQKGLPEGVVAAGGYVDGFLYFNKVSPNLKRVEFVARLQNAKTGKAFGDIRIPFLVGSKPAD